MLSYTGVNYLQITTVHIIKEKHHLLRRKSLRMNFGGVQAKIRIATSQKMIKNKPDICLVNKVIVYSTNMTDRPVRQRNKVIYKLLFSNYNKYLCVNVLYS